MSLGKLIRDIRVKSGLTQIEFARRLYKDQRTICAYERNRIQPPVDFLMQLSREFGVQILIGNKVDIYKESNMKDEIFKFITEHLTDEDYLLDELIEYENILTDYSDQLPIGFIEKIEEWGLEKEKIKGIISKDEYEQLGIFYLGDYRSITLCWCDHDSNDDWLERHSENPRRNEETCEEGDKYLYWMNELWSVYLQRDFPNITREELIMALYSCIDALFLINDERIYDLGNLDVTKLKEYKSDISLTQSTIPAIAITYKDKENNINIEFLPYNKEALMHIKEGYYNERTFIESVKLEIPSDDIVICTNGEYYMGLVVVTKAYYEKRLSEARTKWEMV